MAVWGLEDKTSGPTQLAGGVRPREEPRQKALILGGFFFNSANHPGAGNIAIMKAARGFQKKKGQADRPGWQYGAV